MNLSDYREIKPFRLKRIVWCGINATLFRLLVGSKLKFARNILLCLFGAKVPLDSLVYSTCKVYAPWNLEIGRFSCIGPETNIYNKDLIQIGDNTVISQGCFLCTASHDIEDVNHSLITSGIVVGDRAWVSADAFVGPGVTIGEGAVVGARSVVTKDVEPWSVVAGNPAKFIKKRVLKNMSGDQCHV